MEPEKCIAEARLWLGKRSAMSTRPKVNFKPGSNVGGDSMWLPAVVVLRARLERIPGRRQRLGSDRLVRHRPERMGSVRRGDLRWLDPDLNAPQ